MYNRIVVCLAITAFLASTPNALWSGDLVVESFRGDGEFTSVGGNFDGLDNPGWSIQSSGHLSPDGFRFDLDLLASATDDRIVEWIHRPLTSEGSFRIRVAISDLSTEGDISELDSQSASSSGLVYYTGTGDSALTFFFQKTNTTSSDTLLLMTQVNSLAHAIEVHRGTNILLDVTYDSERELASFSYDDDVLDNTPAIVVRTSPFSAVRTNDEYMEWGASTSNAARKLSGTIQELSYFPGLPGSPGDFNGNGTLDTQDIEALFAALTLADAIFDVNMDTVIDANDVSYWLHDLKNTYYGDANLDGEFNSADLINVFQAGEYEDAITANSTWSTGDWNGDGEFTTSDLVVAFQDGGYEQGPREAVSAVPEPSGLLTLLIGTMGFLLRTRR